MSKISVSKIEQGDIIRAPSRYKSGRNGTQFSSYYVHNIHYTQEGQVHFFDVFELTAYDLRQSLPKGDKFVQITGLEDKNKLGLNPDKNYIIFVERQRLNNTPEQLGQKKPGIVHKSGSLANTLYQDAIWDRITTLGGEDKLYSGAEEGPREAKVPNWDRLRPYHLGHNPSADPDQKAPWEFRPLKRARDTKKYGRMGPASQGEVIDISLEDAVTYLGMDDTLANAFRTPARGTKLKPLFSLRQVFELADKQPEKFEKYLPNYSNFLLEQFEEEGIIDDPELVDILQDPKKSSTPTIETLKEATDALSEKGVAYFKSFYGVGDVRAEKIASQIITARDYVEALKKDNVQTIKDVWKEMTSDYLSMKRGDETIEKKYDKGSGDLAIILRPATHSL